MNYILIILGSDVSSSVAKDGIAASAAMDALAAKGRLGVIDGWKGLDSLCASEPDDGQVCFTCGLASLDSEGNVRGFLADEGEIQELLEKVNNTQIDGVNFQAELKGRDVLLTLDGEWLSRRVYPNPCTPGMPLTQVCAAVSGKTEAAKKAKKTASAINKLTYRLAKKSCRALFIKKVGARKPLPDGFEVFEMEGDIDSGLLVRVNDNRTVTVVIQPAGSSANVLIHGGGIMPGETKKFCSAACSRGFKLQADALLPWVQRATGSGF